MRRDPLTVIAVVFFTAVVALIVWALLAMPEPQPARTVYVNVGR